MEEVKKKRVRPTWQQVRALEGELKELRERFAALSSHAVESDAKLTKLLSVGEDYEAQKVVNRELMEELGRVSEALKAQRAEASELVTKVVSLENRSFWQRLFNKK